MGHPVAKVELIVLGGTWSFHPEAYQIWFAKRCFDALNDFGKGIDRSAERRSGPGPLSRAAIAAGWARTRVDASYNHLVRGFC